MPKHASKHWWLSDRPHSPFWKDEKVAGIQLKWVVLALLAGLVAFVLLIVWGYFKLSDVTDSNRDLIHKVQRLQARQNEQRNEERHRQNLQDRRIDAEIHNAVCLAINGAPNSSPNVRKLRRQFNCPATGHFVPVPIPRISDNRHPGHKAQQTSAQPGKSPSSSEHSSATVGRSPTHNPHSPRPSGSSSGSKTTSPQPPGIKLSTLPINSVVCRVAPALCKVS